MIKNAPVLKFITSAAIALMVATPIKKTTLSDTLRRRVDSKIGEKGLIRCTDMTLAIMNRLQQGRDMVYTQKKQVKGE